jgi:hypothetical protein
LDLRAIQLQKAKLIELNASSTADTPVGLKNTEGVEFKRLITRTARSILTLLRFYGTD